MSMWTCKRLIWILMIQIFLILIQMIFFFLFILSFRSFCWRGGGRGGRGGGCLTRSAEGIRPAGDDSSSVSPRLPSPLLPRLTKSECDCVCNSPAK